MSRRHLLAAWIGFLTAFAGGCGEGGAAQEGRAAFPVDTTRHSVPLERIVFDTFRPGARAVPLTEASPELVRRLRDAIPPLDHPAYESAEEADRWLDDGDVVLGYAAGGEAWAYPVRILNFHEIVNDVLAGEPVLVSYCPLCASGVVFDRRVEGRVLRFGNTSALYEADMVMVDDETDSYWWQVAGEAIVGPLTGTRLRILPATTTPWERWRALHPHTRVLSRKTGHDRNYDRNPFIGYARQLDRERFPFPVSEAARDGRLPAGTRVVSVKIGDEVRAYPADGEPRAYDDTLGETPVVVFTAEGGGTAFEARADGRRLTFAADDNGYRDRQTGSRWTAAGRAVSGPLVGTGLAPVPSRTSFWFAIVAAEPDVTVAAP